jgi:hypothetical protein
MHASLPAGCPIDGWMQAIFQAGQLNFHAQEAIRELQIFTINCSINPCTCSCVVCSRSTLHLQKSHLRPPILDRCSKNSSKLSVDISVVVCPYRCRCQPKKCFATGVQAIVRDMTLKGCVNQSCGLHHVLFQDAWHEEFLLFSQMFCVRSQSGLKVQ